MWLLYSLGRWASCVTVNPQRNSEGSVIFIIRVHLDLIIPRESIHEGHALKPACVIYHNISDGERELTLWACLVEIAKVDADSDLPILLGNGDDVGHPIRVLFFSDKL